MATLRVECGACRSKFRLDSSLFKGAAAISVRCRKCGGSIIVRNPEASPATPSSVADVTFDSMAALWQTRYREASNGKSEFSDVRQTKDFVSKYGVSSSSFSALKEIGESYLRLVKGISSGHDLAEIPGGRRICLSLSLLNVESVEHLPGKTAKIANEIIDETFFLGLAAHLILSEHPHRHKIFGMAKEGLSLDFLEACQFADRDMREYDRDMSGLPGDLFREQFARRVEPVFAKELSVGFWRMGKVRAGFRKIFFSGIALGVLSDGHAEEYLVNA